MLCPFQAYSRKKFRPLPYFAQISDKSIRCLLCFDLYDICNNGQTFACDSSVVAVAVASFNICW